jgi:kumamolisin
MTDKFADSKVADSAAKEATHNEQVALSQAVHKDAERATQDQPPSKWDQFKAITEEGIKDIPAGVLHTLEHPGSLIENGLISAGIGFAGKILLPEAGPLGRIAAIGLGAYFTTQMTKPIVHAYQTGFQTGNIETAGRELGDTVGGMAVALPVGIYGYKVGAGLGARAMMSSSMDGFADLKAGVLNPINDKLSTAIFRGESTGARFSVQADGKALLLGSQRQTPLHATLQGDVSATQEINVNVMLKSKASDLKMDRMNARISAGQRGSVSDAELLQKFGADEKGVSALQKFAGENGLKIAAHDEASSLFRLEGTAQQMEKAFGAHLQEYKNGAGRTFRARSGMIETSADLAPYLEGVFGLDTRPMFKTNFIMAEAPLVIDPQNPLFGGKGLSARPAAPGSIAIDSQHPVFGGKGPSAVPLETVYDPEQVYKAYNFPEDLKGDNLKVSFTSLGGDLPRGMDDWLAKRGAPGGIKVAILDGQELMSDPQGADVENALDAGNLKLGLPKAEVTMLAGTNSDTAFIQSIAEAGKRKSAVHSISWGNNEESWTDQGIRGMSLAAKKTSLQGTTIVAASGDNGALDNSPSRRFQADIPSGLSDVTGVGGTKLTLGANSERLSEEAWSTSGATGGGISEKIPKPDFQKDIQLPANANGTKFDGRGVPDIAFMASPETSWKVFTEDGEVGVGGTSAAAPASAVLFAKAVQMLGQPLGGVNALLYKFASSHPQVFNDITLGDNGGYKAGPGWDATTGLGSMDGQKFIDALKAEAPKSSINAIPFVGLNQRSDAQKNGMHR